MSEVRPLADPSDALLPPVWTPASRLWIVFMTINLIGTGVLVALVSWSVLTGTGLWGNNIPAAWAFPRPLPAGKTENQSHFIPGASAHETSIGSPTAVSATEWPACSRSHGAWPPTLRPRASPPSSHA